MRVRLKLRRVWRRTLLLKVCMHPSKNSLKAQVKLQQSVVQSACSQVCYWMQLFPVVAVVQLRRAPLSSLRYLPQKNNSYWGTPLLRLLLLLRRIPLLHLLRRAPLMNNSYWGTPLLLLLRRIPLLPLLRPLLLRPRVHPPLPPMLNPQT